MNRTPPKPVHFDSPKGKCRYCGEDIIRDGKPNMRANWHPGCLETYKQIYWPGHTRKAVWRRDKGKCSSCGEINSKTGPWQADHQKPLFEANGDISYWYLDNLVTLCTPCHKVKSAHEAFRRAQDRKKN